MTELALYDVLPDLLAGTAPRTPNDLTQGGYFGGRKPEDGRIDWSQPAQDVYNLHRAVAPPYPGAWTMLGGRTLVLGRARMAAGSFAGKPGLARHDGQLLGIGGDGQALRIVELMENGKALDASQLHGLLSSLPDA